MKILIFNAPRLRSICNFTSSKKFNPNFMAMQVIKKLKNSQNHVFTIISMLKNLGIRTIYLTTCHPETCNAIQVSGIKLVNNFFACLLFRYPILLKSDLLYLKDYGSMSYICVIFSITPARMIVKIHIIMPCFCVFVSYK